MEINGWGHCCYRSTAATIPASRTDNPGWYAEHVKHIELSRNSRVGRVLLIGDDFIEKLASYPRIWSKHFGSLQALNFGLRGDRTQNVLWRIETGALPVSAETIIVHVGVNNITFDHSRDIANGIGCIALMCQKTKPNARVLLCGLIPFDLSRKKKIRNVNRYLKLICASGYISNCFYVRPDTDWLLDSGMLNLTLYSTTFSEVGMDKFAKPIKDLIDDLNNKVDIKMSSDDSEVSTDEEFGNLNDSAPLRSIDKFVPTDNGFNKEIMHPINHRTSYSSHSKLHKRRSRSRRSRHLSKSTKSSPSRSSRSRSSHSSRSRSRSISRSPAYRRRRNRSRSRCHSRSKSPIRSNTQKDRWIERAMHRVSGSSSSSYELVSAWSPSGSASRSPSRSASRSASPADKSSSNNDKTSNDKEENLTA